MIDIAIDIFSWITGKLFTWLRTPLSIRITDFYFDVVTNEPGDSIVIITPYPTYYCAAIKIINRSNRKVHIDRLYLTIDNDPPIEATKLPDALEPGEPWEGSLVFPVDKSFKPDLAESFMLYIDPTVGRTNKISLNKPPE